MSDYLDYILSAMRRASATDCLWMLTPTQAGVLVAEVERLREEVERLQQDAIIARSVETSLTVEVEHLRGERAAVVALLRDGVSSAILYRADDVSMDSASAGVAMLLAHVANAIERGEHRREEGA